MIATVISAIPALEEYRAPLLQDVHISWVPHEKHQFVPQIAFTNPGYVATCAIGFLKRHLSEATLEDFEPFDVEHD
jgi:hypothetical protein